MKNKGIVLIGTSILIILVIIIPVFFIGWHEKNHHNYSKKPDPFFNYKQKKFVFNNHNAIIVYPHTPLPDKNWVWRARFWGHAPQVDLVLLENGFHLVHIEAPNLFGNNTAINLWNDFYHYLTNEHNLNAKCVLEGMSRGGLYIYNWAAENPEKVECIYADAPVCDIRSWPGGLGKGVGSKSEWIKCLNEYQINEKKINEFKGSPIFKTAAIAKHKIPIIHVCGDNDTLVPMEENTYPFIDSLRKYNHDVTLIVKKGQGHHPHSLEDPSPIVKFILENTVNKTNFEIEMNIN